MCQELTSGSNSTLPLLSEWKMDRGGQEREAAGNHADCSNTAKNKAGMAELGLGEAWERLKDSPEPWEGAGRQTSPPKWSR